MRAIPRMTRRLTASGVLACLALGSVAALAQQNEPPSGDTERGATLYRRFGCYECHLYSGAGYDGVPGGAPLVPMSLSLDAFTAFLRHPSVPRRMPPYGAEQLSDDEAAAIYAFLRTLPPPRPARDIPELAEIIEQIENSGAR
jgi:mono/diheme cytochrome c family protein